MVLMCSREYSKYFFSFESCKQGCTCSLQSTRQSGGSFVAFLFSFFFLVLFHLIFCYVSGLRVNVVFAAILFTLGMMMLVMCIC